MSTRLASRPSRVRGTAHLLPFPFGIGVVFGGVVVAICSLAGLVLDDDGPVPGLPVLAVVALVVGPVLLRMRREAHITTARAMVMVVAGWVGFTLVATLALWLSGELAGFGDAAFEAVSATTTTGFTTVVDPQLLSDHVQLLRVLLPWAAGLGVLVVGMGVLPVAIGGVELTPVQPLHGGRQLVTSTRAALRKIVGLYLLLTAALWLGFLVVGMPFFDAVSYGLSTASTGGLSNHAASIGHFDSIAVDAVATAGMIAAGGNLAVVWWAFRGAVGPVLRSTELRLYLSLLVLGVLLVWIGGSNFSFGDSAFAVASMLSTTGLRSGNWAAAGNLPQAVLLIAAGIGAMSGSVGSGFRLARVAWVALEVRRTLRRLLKPRRIDVIRFDGHAVREDSLTRTYGYLWMHLFTLAAVAALINARDFSLHGTLSFSLTLVSNVGVYVEGAEIGAVPRIGGWSQAVAMVAMVLGRLSIYPVLVTVAGVWRWLTRLRPAQAIGARG